MMRPKILPFVSLLVFIFLLVGCQQKKDDIKPKPNILFILADDLGYHDLSCTGSDYYETPNIDRIAAEGMVFTSGYACCQVCSPSRASIMSGRFPARHGITDYIGARSGEEWRKMNRHTQLLPAEYLHNLPHEYTVLPEAMKAAGYKTFFAGKWHLGSKGSWPEDHGFDINKGGWDKGSPMGGFFAPWDNPNLENGPDGESLTLRLAQETASFMKAHRDTSFFAFLSFYAVHSPIETTREKWARYRLKAEKQGIAEKGFEMGHFLPIRQEQDNPVYAGLVETMDDAVGVVLNTLDELGIADNTIVIFTSDNGGVAAGDAFSTSNKPLRAGKGYQFEGGIREPYFIKIPWLGIAGKKSDVPVTGTDFYPTLLEVTGQQLKPGEHIDGLSLVPLFQGESLPERPLIWHYPHYGNQGGEPSSIIRLGKWKLIHYYEDDHQELYNLKNDPGEKTDISSDNRELTVELSEKLFNYLTETGARFPEKDPEYNENLERERMERVRTELMPRLEKQRLDFLSEDFDPGNNWWGSQPKFNQETIETAQENGRQATEGFKRSLHFVEGWLRETDEVTGLIPTNLSGKSDVWEPHNSAADNYAFMVLTTYLTDKGLYKGKMTEMLETEKSVTSRIESLPDSWSFSKQDFLSEDPNPGNIIFGTSEYIKDGLIPLTEYIGPSPWSSRMMEMLDDLLEYMGGPKNLETIYQERMASVEEVNGEMLQTLTRVYWMTGDDKYLGHAKKIGHYYLLGQRDLSQSEYLRIRDHGCEVIGGLSELYVTLHFVDPELKAQYKPALYKLLDRTLEIGLNEDGLFYNAINPKTGEVVDKTVVDNWGYVFNAYYSVWLVDRKEEYRQAVVNGFKMLNEKYRNFKWEGNSHDGYADALESGINLYNRIPDPGLKTWIDSEMQVMFDMQQESGIIGGWHGDGNFARTAIMYSLWKTQGAHIQPWRRDVVLGAEKYNDDTYFVLTAETEWEGKLIFDAQRHKTILNLPLDYPRINQFPEWFTGVTDQKYSIVSSQQKLSGDYSGKELLNGIPVKIKPGEVLILSLSKEE